MSAFVVVNPHAARIARDWPKIRPGLEALFPLMTVAQSQARGDTAKLVRAALKDGHMNIIAVGGDGTINEAVNGFFEHGAALSPDAVFGFVSPSLTSDFRRTFGIRPHYTAAIARLKQSRLRKLDVGHVSCLSASGQATSRFFINAASFGLSGRLAALRGRARLGLLSVFHSLAALAGWRAAKVRLITDTGYDEIDGIANVAIANGRWFGGGLRVAPQAEPGDGLFDIVVMGGAPRRKIWRQMKALRAGALPSGTRLVRAARLVAAPTLETRGRICVETDGESAGFLPATFEIIPGAINLRC